MKETLQLHKCLITQLQLQLQFLQGKEWKVLTITITVLTLFCNNKEELMVKDALEVCSKNLNVYKRFPKCLT